MPTQLREMFAYIFGTPTNPIELWKEFKQHFIQDYCYRYHNNSELCINCESYAMKDVQDVLIIHGKSYLDFNLPRPATNIRQPQEDNDKDYELATATEMKKTLNPEQLLAFNAIVDALQDNTSTPRGFFIDGPGGSGKTYLYHLLIHYVRGQGHVVSPAATTGIAANLLPGGRTMHSLYGIPIPINETSVYSIKTDTNAANKLKNTTLFMLDECTMAQNHSLNVIDRLLRDVMTIHVDDKNNVPFGGKVFILGGDFRQCLPVLTHATRTEIVDCCLKYCQLCKHFTRLPLFNNMSSRDPEYSTWLLKLGDGQLSNEYNLGEDVIEIPPDMLSSACLITDIFGTNIHINVNDTECVLYAASHAILCPKNEDVEFLNSQIMNRLSGQYVLYTSDDSVDADDAYESENYPVEFLHSLTPSGMPPHPLQLKIGTIVMLLRNLNTKKRLCNGTRRIVTSLNPHII
ncbi:uncharacterized protein [Phyllobates terribilis]|uniref:uncharacterized protein n=1 Tax=Phyllobates terribilis TaxID=111132 RepID=UPI003CCA7209